MINKVKNYIESHGMLKPGDKVMIGVSGGADSVCLLLVLLHLRDVFKIEIEAVHVHHGLRGLQADEDAKYVQSLCKSKEVLCHLIYGNIKEIAKTEKLSEEEAGRKLRYQSFYEVMKARGGNKIAVAHHKEDQAETILFHLLRGSGLKGLSGIPVVRDSVIRPLLCCNREEIEAYLSGEEVSYRTDSTNFTDDYTRNKIRNHVLPFVRNEINDKAVENIIHAGELISQANEYFEGIADEFYGNHVREEDGRVFVKLKPLKELKPILQGYVFRKGIKAVAGDLKDITKLHLDSMKGLIEKEVGKQVSLPGEIIGRKDYEELVIERVSIHKKEDLELPKLSFSTFPYKIQEEIPQNRYTKWFDYDRIKDTLTVRTREEGDYIEISSGKKKLKSYMIDEKIPREKRDRIPLLADGHHILWVIGYRISEGKKVTKDTKNILQAEYKEGKYNE